MAQDPRTSARYSLMESVIELIELEGPQTLEQICYELSVSPAAFREARYSLPGQLALEDQGKIIPRPVVAEGYIYKLAEGLNTGAVDSDGRLNLQTATSELLTRVATIYTDVEGLVMFAPARSAARKLLRKLQKAVDSTLDRAEDVAIEMKAPISAKAQHLLDRIA